MAGFGIHRIITLMTYIPETNFLLWLDVRFGIHRNNTYYIPEGNPANVLPGKTTEGFILLCRFTVSVLSIPATEMTSGDSCCSSSLDILLAVTAVSNQIRCKVHYVIVSKMK